jgi:hypothetical protein
MDGASLFQLSACHTLYDGGQLRLVVAVPALGDQLVGRSSVLSSQIIETFPLRRVPGLVRLEKIAESAFLDRRPANQQRIDRG